ncbi:MAG TPA: molecular chaperone Hsp90 [Lachnoclostridium sp.]|nr:molecular chaperone Hsp90 [Lachnoclostridium sp.]
MDKEVLDYAVEKTHELMSAPSCSNEAKAAAQTWLDSIGTDREAAETKKYIDEIEADILPVDSLIGFAGSEAGIQVFGEETAKNIEAHAIEIKSAGEKYCDCPACAAVAAILSKKDVLLK